MDGKVCRKCCEWKLLDQFPKGKGNPDGLQYKCRACIKAYYQENRARIREHQHQRYLENPEPVKERVRLWREQNPERTRETKHQHYLATRQLKGRKFAVSNGVEKFCTRCEIWKPLDQFQKCSKNADGLISRCKSCSRANWQANQERYRKEKRDRYHADVEAARAQRRQWNATNPQKAKESKRRDYLNHKARAYAAYHKRRALKRGNGGVHTPKEWTAMCNFFGSVCLCCGAAGNLTRDHVIPLVHGGRNDIANLQPLCLRCNLSKNARTIDYRDPDRLAAFLSSLRATAE